MEKLKIPLKWIFILPFLTLIILAVGINSYFSFGYGRQAADKLVWQVQTEIVQNVATQLTDFFNVPSKINNANARALRLGILDTNNTTALERHFWNQLKTYDGISPIYLGYAEGGISMALRREIPETGRPGKKIVISTSHGKQASAQHLYAVDAAGNKQELVEKLPNYDARRRPWFKAAAKREGPGWSPVFTSFAGDAIVISLNQSVNDSRGKHIGVVCADLNLTYLNDFLRSQKITSKGRIFIIEKSGLLVGSSLREAPLRIKKNDMPASRLNANESKDPLVRETANVITEKIKQNAELPLQFHFDFHKERQMVSARSFKLANGPEWFITVVLPESEFIGPLQKSKIFMYVMVILSIITATIISLYWANWLTKPITMLNDAAQGATKGKWKQLELTRRRDELGELIESFNYMTRQLQETFNKLEHSEERYRAFVQNSSEVIYCFDFKEPVNMSLPVQEQLDLIYDNAYLSECNDAYAKLAGLESREELIGVTLAEIMPRDEPENVIELEELIQNQYTTPGIESIEKYPSGEERILINNSVGIIKDGFLQRAWGTALDITDLKDAERKLKQAEQRYRTVADFTYDWEYWQGTDGKMIYVSPSCERISGYSPDDFLMNDNLLDKIIILEDSPQWHHRACNIEDNTVFEPESILFRIQRKDGEKRWIEHACQPVYDSEGNSLGIRASNRDVTKRYEAELALKSSEANLRAYMDNTDDMICARDPEGALIFWNESFNQSCIRNFGVEASVGLKTAELLPPDQKKRLMELSKNWRDVFQGNAFEVEYDFTPHNNERRMLATKWTPIEIDKRVVWAAEITRDITENKLAEENIRRSEQQLRLIADSLPVFIAYVDSNETYIFNNKAYLDFFNLTIDQIVGMPIDDVLGPETYKHVRPHVKKALAGELTSFEVEIIKSGNKHQLESTYIPDMDQKGSVNGFFVLATDVTNRKHREAELQRHREELAHVSRLTTMGELTASMAHELNQPLTAILSNAQAARRFLEHDTVDIEEVKEILDDIIGDDRRAGQVIKRLRGFLKRGEFYLKTWDINEVIQEVVTLVHSDAVIRNVSVHLDLLEELPHVLGDRIQIQQVLLNLIINGLDAMKEVHPESRNLIIKTEYEIDKDVKVSVGDSGSGIHQDQMQQIFEPFHTTKADGMGMGLSINRSIIQAHQGKIWTENNVKQGATFHFTLPIASGDIIDGE